MNSTNSYFTLIITAASMILCSYSCEKENQASQQEEKPTLEGSWDLVKYIPHSSGGTDWATYGDSIVYQKHLTPNHFTWFKYDKKNDRIMGMGGGTYVIRDDKYIENINFFYPPGSSELGQAIPFSFSIKDNQWEHIGFAKSMATNMETGKIEVIDSTKIEEVWKRTGITGNDNKQLVGTWALISYRDSLNGEYTDYPEFVGYLKLLTPTHFTWIYYDRFGDEIYAAGSGRYMYDGKTYSEAIDMLYPDNFGQLGSTIAFQTKINHNVWKHVGYLPSYSIDNNSGHIVHDSSLIDEKWKLHQASVIDGITF